MAVIEKLIALIVGAPHIKGIYPFIIFHFHFNRFKSGAGFELS